MSQVRRSLSSLALPLLGAWVLGVACYEEPLYPQLGYETDDVSCSDSTDNDGDCLVDCEDPDCIELSTLCGEIIPEVPLEELPETPRDCFLVPDAAGVEQLVCAPVNLQICRDFVDNDLNGQYDCGDRKCQDVLETSCLTEVTNELCSDGFDNDQNGFLDCRDFGCRRSPLVDVCHEGGRDDASCVDGSDNDGDGKVDCEDDCDETCIEDNDAAKLILEPLGLEDDPNLVGEHCCIIRQRTDPSACAYARACGQPEADLAACSNGEDDDHDGYVDCLDRDCLTSDDPEAASVCDDLEETLGDCTDGRDNDGDGLSDCDDPECGQNPDPEFRAHCNGQETSVAQCTDGLDNDGNSFVDCDDFSCSRSDDPAVLAACEADVASCSDGVDNDGDGYIDCVDFSCSTSEDPELQALCMDTSQVQLPPSRGGAGGGTGDPQSGSEDTVEECGDVDAEGEPIDNDADGFANCADYSCSMSADPALQELCPLEDTLEDCMDGIDNDDNGFIDCADFGCSMSDIPEVIELCEQFLEESPETCKDGKDNDGDGFTDCADFSCSQADDFATRQVCFENLGLSNAESDRQCSDGIDNDEDGFIDCDDFECSHDAEVSVCPELSYCETGRR